MRTHTDRDLRVLVARASVPSPPGHHAPLDLAGACLEMADIPHIDLTGADLRGANLRGAMLWGAMLDGACLDEADLTCADLTWSSLVGCSLKGTLLVEADLDEALVDHGTLSNAVTAGADMITLSFTALGLGAPTNAQEMFGRPMDDTTMRTHLQGVSPALRERLAVPKSKRLERARRRVLGDADLQELLRGSASTGRPLNLRGCNLSGAVLRGASLRGACLAFTDATGADIEGVDLTGANLEGAIGWK